MRHFVHFIPIVTTIVTIPFTVILFKHWRRKPEALYVLWWAIGVMMYGVGTLTESLTTILGWQLPVFKAWYISGALLGGAPLAQGSIYLLMKRKTGHILTACLLTVVLIASVFVLMSPVDMSLVEQFRLSGKVFEWQWVRAFSPFINTYALIFLVGGAIWSAVKYRSAGDEYRVRYIGNILIAVGALLPGIGGTATRAGYVEVLYVTELVGILLIWLGYHKMAADAAASIHANQAVATS
jgi:hypothetical protein